VPTYQYACTDPACDHRFEQFQSFTDAALTDCPVCSSRLRKVYGSVGVVFKGSGFYRNDSRAEANGAKKKRTSDSEAGASTASASSASSSESSSSSDSSSGSNQDKSASKESAASSGTSETPRTAKASAKSGKSSASSSGDSKS